MAGNVDVGDHTQEWLAALAPALSRGLEQVGLAAEGHAKGLLTSQIGTAPKPLAQNPHCKGRPNLTAWHP